uniref:Uncharacterized protein n=1 Tax=Ciona intestinalis TaxID=7719 RepID=H2XWQ3_CIOIN
GYSTKTKHGILWGIIDYTPLTHNIPYFHCSFKLNYALLESLGYGYKYS